MKPLIWALILLFGVIYLSSVVMLQLIEDNEKSKAPEIRHFYGSLAKTQYTMFMCITGGLTWHEAADPLLELSSLFAVFFIFYIAFCAFCVANIVTGIFVENTKTMMEYDDEVLLTEEAANRAEFMREVVELFRLLDDDGSGDLTADEFEQRFNDEKLQLLLKKLGIDVWSINPTGLFHTLDFDGNGTLSIDEFAIGLMRFRGMAKALDLSEVRHFVSKVRVDVTDIRQTCDALLDYVIESRRIDGNLSSSKSLLQPLADVAPSSSRQSSSPSPPPEPPLASSAPPPEPLQSTSPPHEQPVSASFPQSETLPLPNQPS